MDPTDDITGAGRTGEGDAPRVVLLSPAGAPGLVSVQPGVQVVTPNPRAARARGVLAVSLERLARDLLRPMGLQRAPELTRWRALRDAVRRAWAPDDVDGTARAVAGTVREVLRAGLDGAAPPAGSERLERVLELAFHYRASLLADGLVDPAEALWWVARGGAHGSAPPERRRLHVVGYPRIGAAETAFLAAVCAPGSVLELPEAGDPLFEANRSVAAVLEARGWRVEGPGAAPRGSVQPRAALRGLRLPSRDAEVRTALTEVKRLLAAGTPPDAIALVARDDAAYGPPVRAIAWEYGLPVVTSYAVPLRDTPVGAWTATLVEVVREGLPFEAVARLLAHPLTGGLTPAVWDAARSDHPRGAAAWGALDGRTEALAWPHRGTRAELLACLHRSWDALGVTQRSQARRA
ncbi:MAG: hypothetical protein P8Y05_12345, partial [Deinococcales bacterium]